MIFLQINRNVFRWIAAAVFLFGLVISTLTAARYDGMDIMLITPAASNKSVVSSERLEEINGEDFLLTYEIISQTNIRAMNSNYVITLRKTNYAYRFVLNYRMLNGAFFTEADQNKRQKSAVLNKAAALAMFGNLDLTGRAIVIDGEQYLIAGVMEDRDDMSGSDAEMSYNVYLPASISGDNPASFAIQMKAGISDETVKNEVKNLLISSGSYEYIRIGTLKELIFNMLIIALKSVFIVLLLKLIVFSTGRMQAEIHQIKNFHKQFYLREIYQQYPGLFIRVSAAVMVLLFAAALILSSTLDFIDYYLLLSDTVPLPIIRGLSIFGDAASDLVLILYLSIFLFFGFLLNLLLPIVSGLKNYFNEKITSRG